MSCVEAIERAVETSGGGGALTTDAMLSSAGRDFSTLWLGQRQLTVLLYLDDAFDGGATAFPQLDVEVTPVRWGRFLLDTNP
jgi:hypothetical protein